jgi:Skp family chaperone for outer membrane proteins
LDAILPALISALPQLGGAGLALFILIIVLRSAATDRADYRTQLKEQSKRHNDELDELKEDIKDLRKQVDDLNAALDLEREQRRRAEDMAAEALRRRRPG